MEWVNARGHNMDWNCNKRANFSHYAEFFTIQGGGEPIIYFTWMYEGYRYLALFCITHAS